MAVALVNERLVLFSRPCDYWPGKIPHISQLHRWRTTGLLNPSRVRVKLETVKLGGLRYTSHEAVARFTAALNGQQPPMDMTRAQEALRAVLAMRPRRAKRPLT